MKRSSICLIVIFLFISLGCSHKSGENDIKVMTLNIRYDNPGDSIYAWPNRAQEMCNFIKDEKPDILGMQEVLWNQYMVLDSVLINYSSVGAGRDDGARGGEMNPFFFRKERFDLVRNITCLLY